MRVLYIHQHFSTPRGATGLRSYDMATALVARGHQVRMVCGSYGGGASGLTGPFKWGKRQGLVDGIEVVEFSLSYSNSSGFVWRSVLFAAFALRSISLALTTRYDLVFATTTPLTAGIPGILARWLRRKPFVFEVRDLWPELPRAMGVIRNPLVLGAMSLLEWASYHSAHRLIALAPGIVAGILRRGISRAAITLIPNGCDRDLFRRRNHGWRPDSIRNSDLLAVFAGTHGIANGLDAALDAAAVLRRRGRDDIKLLFIGQGKLKPRLQARADLERLTNVSFHDPVDKTRLAELFTACDVGMQLLANVPSFYDGTSPNKFFDYIAMGIPVLNNYPGWLAELIEETRCGYPIAPDDPGAFADALEHAADNRDKLKEMGSRSLELAARFDRRVLAGQFVDWLEGAPVS